MAVAVVVVAVALGRAEADGRGGSEAGRADTRLARQERSSLSYRQHFVFVWSVGGNWRVNWATVWVAVASQMSS